MVILRPQEPLHASCPTSRGWLNASKGFFSLLCASCSSSIGRHRRERERVWHTGWFHKNRGCWEGRRGWIRPGVRAEESAPLAPPDSSRESQCAARRASCRTSWFYPRWATMYPDTTTTPSLTGRPPRIVNIHSNDSSTCAWWVSTIFLRWFFIYVSTKRSMSKSVSPSLRPPSPCYLLVHPTTPSRHPALCVVTCTRTLMRILGERSRDKLKKETENSLVQMYSYANIAVMWATANTKSLSHVLPRVPWREEERLLGGLFLKREVSGRNETSRPRRGEFVPVDGLCSKRKKTVLYVLPVVSRFCILGHPQNRCVSDFIKNWNCELHDCPERYAVYNTERVEKIDSTNATARNSLWIKITRKITSTVEILIYEENSNVHNHTRDSQPSWC